MPWWDCKGSSVFHRVHFFGLVITRVTWLQVVGFYLFGVHIMKVAVIEVADVATKENNILI